MAAQPLPVLMTLEEYLHTAFHPDCEYVDGVLEERTIGSKKHSVLQMWLGFWFVSHQREWGIQVGSDLRTQVTPTRVRMPDVAIFPAQDDLSERVQTEPLILAIEILSPDDRMHRIVMRLEEYIRMGIPEVWVLDPEERIAFRYRQGGLRLVEEDRLTVPGSQIYLDVPQVFAVLDQHK